MRAKAFYAVVVLSFTLLLAPATSRCEDNSVAGAFATDLGNKALAIITNASLSKNDKHIKLEKLFIQNVDIDWIGKFVLGRHWRDATDEQKKSYLANYRNFIIKHYTSNLAEFTNADFEVAKVVTEDRGGNVVTMRLKRPQAEDVIVDYTVRKKEGEGLKVYDIVVEGVSMITTQRSEFSSVVSQKGLDYLVKELNARSQKETIAAQ